MARNKSAWASRSRPGDCSNRMASASPPGCARARRAAPGHSPASPRSPATPPASHRGHRTPPGYGGVNQPVVTRLLGNGPLGHIAPPIGVMGCCLLVSARASALICPQYRRDVRRNDAGVLKNLCASFQVGRPVSAAISHHARAVLNTVSPEGPLRPSGAALAHGFSVQLHARSDFRACQKPDFSSAQPAPLRRPPAAARRRPGRRDGSLRTRARPFHPRPNARL